MSAGQGFLLNIWKTQWGWPCIYWQDYKNSSWLTRVDDAKRGGKKLINRRNNREIRLRIVMPWHDDSNKKIKRVLSVHLAAHDLDRTRQPGLCSKSRGSPISLNSYKSSGLFSSCFLNISRTSSCWHCPGNMHAEIFSDISFSIYKTGNSKRPSDS